MIGVAAIWLCRGPRREHARLSLIALSSFAAIALVYDSYEEWAGDGSYSTRFLAECVVLMAPGLCHFLSGLMPRVRWALAGVLTAYSYGLFLLTRGRLIDQTSQFDVGESLAAYGYVFREHVPLSTIASRIWQSSFSMRFLAQRPMLLAALIGAWLGLAFVVWLLWPRQAPTESRA